MEDKSQPMEVNEVVLVNEIDLGDDTTNILNAEVKSDKTFVTKWKLCEEKNHSGAAKPRKSTIQKQS
jgi:hypothetical protein